MIFNNSNRTEFEKWLSSSYVHDSIITEYSYEAKPKTLHITLVNAYFHTKMDFHFKNVNSLSIINKNESGNSEGILVGILENDYSFFEEQFNMAKVDTDEEYLHFTLQTFSMDEFHIHFHCYRLLDLKPNSFSTSFLFRILGFCSTFNPWRLLFHCELSNVI